jgi:hypothetical protein
MGAPDPRKPSSAAVASKLSGLTEKARSHWAYQPVKKPTKFPTVKTVSWLANPATPNSFNPVDAFILQKIEEKGDDPIAVAHGERGRSHDLAPAGDL